MNFTKDCLYAKKIYENGFLEWHSCIDASTLNMCNEKCNDYQFVIVKYLNTYEECVENSVFNVGKEQSHAGIVIALASSNAGMRDIVFLSPVIFCLFCTFSWDILDLVIEDSRLVDTCLLNKYLIMITNSRTWFWSSIWQVCYR